MSTPEPRKSVTVSKKTVTISEANHEVEPRESQDRQGARPMPSTTTRAGAAAHALLDDAAGHPKSETEEVLERATENDTKPAEAPAASSRSRETTSGCGLAAGYSRARAKRAISSE